MEQLAEVVVVLQDYWEVVVLSAYLVGLTVMPLTIKVIFQSFEFGKNLKIWAH